jgi:hypothetical protein
VLLDEGDVPVVAQVECPLTRQMLGVIRRHVHESIVLKRFDLFGGQSHKGSFPRRDMTITGRESPPADDEVVRNGVGVVFGLTCLVTRKYGRSVDLCTVERNTGRRRLDAPDPGIRRLRDQI